MEALLFLYTFMYKQSVLYTFANALITLIKEEMQQDLYICQFLTSLIDMIVW